MECRVRRARTTVLGLLLVTFPGPARAVDAGSASLAPPAGGVGPARPTATPEPPPVPPAAGSGAPTGASPTYRIGAGDILRIDVWKETGISGRFPVSARGTIDHPLLGAFPIGDRTVDDAARALEAALGDGFLKNPKVTVEVAEFRSFHVSVVGGVRSPGVYYLRGTYDLLSLVLMAGGFESRLPGMATILRREAPAAGSGPGGEAAPRVISADLTHYLTTGDRAQNVELEPGDLVFIPGGQAGTVTPKTGVTILGEVKSPGVFEVGSEETVMSAILKAGGTTEFASRNNTRLYRSGESSKPVEIRLADILDRGDRRKDVALKPGDLIVVPGRLF